MDNPFAGWLHSAQEVLDIHAPRTYSVSALSSKPSHTSPSTEHTSHHIEGILPSCAGVSAGAVSGSGVGGLFSLGVGAVSGSGVGSVSTSDAPPGGTSSGGKRPRLQTRFVSCARSSHEQRMRRLAGGSTCTPQESGPAPAPAPGPGPASRPGSGPESTHGGDDEAPDEDL